MLRRIIVAGGLAAGPAAASKAKRINPSAEVILLEKGSYISYGICELPYYISGEISDYKDLIVYTPEKLSSEKGVTVKPFHELKEIDHRNREILVFDSLESKIIRMAYDKLILALGSQPVKIDTLPEAKNVFNFKFMDDGLKLRNCINLKKNKNAVIFGAGFIGLELADSLRKIGMNVSIFGKSELPMGYFNKRTGEFILKLLKDNDISYKTYSDINSVSMKENYIESIEIDNKFYKSDLIIVAIGVEPNTNLVKGTGIATGIRKGILVDPKMQTALNGIFACGDCCELYNKISMKNGFYPFANLAQKTGWIAGENAAGGSKKFKGVVQAYGLKIFNKEFAHVGLTLLQSEKCGIDAEIVNTSSLDKPSVIAGAEKIDITLLFNKETKVLIGAELFGSSGCALRANILSAAINSRMSLEDLSDLDMVYHPLSTPLRDPIHFCSSLGLK